MSVIDPGRWHELSPFLDQALELEGDERAAWLAELRAKDPRLAREVESRLAQLQTLDDEGFLENDPARFLTHRASACLEYLARRSSSEISKPRNDLDEASAFLGSSAATVPEAIAIRILRGQIATSRGRYAEARTALDSAVAGAKSASMQMSAALGRVDLNLEESRLAEAAADAQKALSLAQSAQGGIPYSNRTGLAWLTLGRVLAKQGETGRAREAFRTAVVHLSNTVDSNYPLLIQARALAAG